MPILNPSESAISANAIYEILDSSAILYKAFPQAINDNFELASGTKMTGKSGGLILQSTSGFALAARGKSMAYKDDALLVIRGTKKFADIISDANAFWVKPNGTRVHKGFNRVFESLKPQLDTFFINHHPACVHIIGHSLGGAIGTLAAEWIKTTNKATSVKLYTFGCPRVGLSRYADVFTNLVGEDNIYRVYNPTDVVPMVPTYPYIHVPEPGTMNYASHYNTVWSPVSLWAHLMRNYIYGVEGQSWKKLSKPQVVAPFDNQYFDNHVEYWMATQNWASLSVHGIHMFYKVLVIILKKILRETGQFFDATAYVGATLIDRMAMYLEKGARAVKEAGVLLTSLMRNILKALGIIVNIPKDLTVVFIRWVFERLSATLYFMAKTAMQNLYR